VESPVESDGVYFQHNLERNVLKLLAYTGREADDELVTKFAKESCEDRRRLFEEEIRIRAQIAGIDPLTIKAQARLGIVVTTPCRGAKTKNPLCNLDLSLSGGTKFKVSSIQFEGPHSYEQCHHSLEALNMMLTAIVYKQCRQTELGHELQLVSITGP